MGWDYYYMYMYILNAEYHYYCDNYNIVYM